MLKKHILFILVAISLAGCGKDEFFYELNDRLQLPDQQFWSSGRVVEFDGRFLWDSLSNEAPVEDVILDSVEPKDWFHEKLQLDHLAKSYSIASKEGKPPSDPGYNYFEGLLHDDISIGFLNDSTGALRYSMLSRIIVMVAEL